MKCKYYITPFKWLSICCIILFYAPLFMGGELSFLIAYGIIVSSLTLLVFILFSIYPKKYYMVSEKGISYHKKDGTEIWALNWERIIKIEYCSAGILPIPVGAEILYKEYLREIRRGFQISYKDYEKIRKSYNMK